MPDAALYELAYAQGVYAEFHDLNGQRHPTSHETLKALLAALGIDASTEGMITASLQEHHDQQATRLLAEEYVIQAGQTNAVAVSQACDWALLSEAGDLLAEGRSQSDVLLPAITVGYYLLHVTCEGQRQNARILARPPRAPSVNDQTGHARCWGMTGALYGFRSDENGGLGNYADLVQAGAALGKHGAAFLGINPVHALGWAAGEMISPYSPTHRGFFNIDHIATDRGMGATPSTALIDYDGFRCRHRPILEAEFKAFVGTRDHEDFKLWQQAQGDSLRDFTLFESLSEHHGADFRLWPSALQSPGKAAQKAAGSRSDFHGWLQWRAGVQIADAQKVATGAGMDLGLYLDLAVGPRPGGAEVWMNAQTVAKGVSIGAPPDHLSPAGQSWALAAHAPRRLAAAFYAPLREMLRKLMARAGILRIDHVLGLLRSFWLPDDGSPGGYVSQPLEAFLAVIAIEADISGCVIVGEDLGLVPEGFREKLNAAGLYSYAVWQFEANHQGKLPPAETLCATSLACFGTHDTPTLQGFWHGQDVNWWQNVGWIGPEAAQTRHGMRAQQRQSLRDLCGLNSLASPPEISQAIHQTLAQAPAALVAVQLDDALGLLDAQNLPGTIDEHPNWRRRLPVPVENLHHAPDIENIAALMPDDRRRATTPNQFDPNRDEDHHDTFDQKLHTV